MRRDTREKIEVGLDEVETKAAELLETIQSDMYEAAKKHLETHISDAVTWDAFCDTINNKPGFVRDTSHLALAELPSRTLVGIIHFHAESFVP